MNFVPVTGNVIPLYGNTTVAPAFLRNSEAELHLMYEEAVEHWNATHDMNDLIDDYVEQKSAKSAQRLGVEKNGCCRNGGVWYAMIGQRHILNTTLASGMKRTEHCCTAWCMVCKKVGCKGCKAGDE